MAPAMKIRQSRIIFKCTWLCESLQWESVCLCCGTVLVHFLCVHSTTQLWTLSAHCLTWPPPNVSPSTAQSWLSNRPRGVGWEMYVCVHGHRFGEGGGSTSFSWSRKLWITLALPVTTQWELSWGCWTQAGYLCFPGLSLTPSWWCREFLPHPHKAGHAITTLIRLARCRPFPVLGSVSALAQAVARTDNRSSRNKVLLIGRKKHKAGYRSSGFLPPSCLYFENLNIFMANWSNPAVWRHSVKHAYQAKYNRVKLSPAYALTDLV